MTEAQHLIKALRKGGWTMERIAEHCGVHVRRVYAWNKGGEPSGAAMRLLRMANFE